MVHDDDDTLPPWTIVSVGMIFRRGQKWVNEWNEYDEYFNNCNEWIIAMNERGEGMHEWNECMIVILINAWMEWIHEWNERTNVKNGWMEWMHEWIKWMHESITMNEN